MRGGKRGECERDFERERRTRAGRGEGTKQAELRKEGEGRKRERQAARGALPLAIELELVLADEEGHGVEGRLGEGKEVHSDAIIHHALLRDARQFRVHLARKGG